MKIRSVLLIVLLFVIASCVSDSAPEQASELNGEIIQNEQLRSKINSAPNEISIDGVQYKTEAYTWRDFAPSIGPSLGLMSLNRLVRVDQNEIPNHLELKQQYIVNGKSIWLPNYDQDDRPNAIPYQKEKVSRDGPEWKVGTKLKVGIKIVNKKTNEEYFLLVPNLAINSTH